MNEQDIAQNDEVPDKSVEEEDPNDQESPAAGDKDECEASNSTGS